MVFVDRESVFFMYSLVGYRVCCIRVNIYA